jgi:hypothetical protein
MWISGEHRRQPHDPDSLPRDMVSLTVATFRGAVAMLNRYNRCDPIRASFVASVY